MQKTGVAAANVENAMRLSGVHHPPNSNLPIHMHCLLTQQNVWGIPVGHYAASAIDAWNKTPKAYRHSGPGSAAKAPIGALHFYDVGQYGHIVMQSGSVTSNGVPLVLTTDVPIDNRVGLVQVDFFPTHWGAGCKYLGWTNWLEGYSLPLSLMPKKPPAIVKPVVVTQKTAAAANKVIVNVQAAHLQQVGGKLIVPGTKV